MKLVKLFCISTAMLFTSSILANNLAFINLVPIVCGSPTDSRDLVITDDADTVIIRGSKPGEFRFKLGPLSPLPGPHSGEELICVITNEFLSNLFTTDSKQTP